MIRELIAELSGLEEPNRRVDEKLAKVAGWVKMPRLVPGGDGSTVTRMAWTLPGEEKHRLPAFTASLDAAVEFVTILHPKAEYGLAFGTREDGRCVAVVGSGPKCSGANAAIALCFAALKAKHGK